MALIVLAILAAIFVALNCFYNLSGLVSLVVLNAGARLVKDGAVDSELYSIYEEKDYVFGDDDFDR